MTFGCEVHRRRGSLLAFLMTTGLWSTQAFCAEPTAIARTRAKGDQPLLAVAFDDKGLLRAEVGPVTSPNLQRGITLSVPDSLLALRAQAKFEIVPVSEQRQAIVVTLPTDVATRLWQALIVAKPGKAVPVVLFQGFTGYVEGEEGLRRGPVLEISEPVDDAGSRRIVFGEIHEDLTLCGRRALLAPQMLSPKTMTLEPAKLQRLTTAERDSAVALIAEPRATEPVVAAPAPTPTVAGEAPSPVTTPALGGSVSLLRAIGASSAIGWPASLTDGDPETTWSENRGGAGRGEFVTFRTPSDVPLKGFDFVVKPAKREVPKGVGPEKLWLVVGQQLYAISFPSDPWKAPLVKWHVSLPAPVKTDCVAVVAESAYGEKPDSLLTLADISAETEFANASIEELVGALAGGGPRAEAASTVLSAMGEPAQRAVATAFDSLDEGGRRVALDIFDHAPCEASSPIYIKALLSPAEAHRLHATDRLHRCGSKAIVPLEQALGDKLTLKHLPLLELLSDIAPDRAIAFLVPRLAGNTATRQKLRELLALAARSPKAQDSLREQLARPELPKLALIDTLRALGPRLVNYADVVVPKLETLLAKETDWKLRFLMLGPAHELTRLSPKLTQSLAQLIGNDQNAYVRAEAIRTMRHADLFAQVLVQAALDPEVRVRHAATQKLGSQRDPKSVEAVSARLVDDSWPLVRAQAAESLGDIPKNPIVDQRLGAALDDKAWLVRVAAADALGKRYATVAAESLLSRFKDRDERFEVRVAAANSLGQLCYEGALSSLTDQANKLAAPTLDLRDRAIAATALNALGAIQPEDIAKRLEPLLKGKDVKAEVRAAAKAAVASQSRCRPTKSPTVKPQAKASHEGRFSMTNDS